MGGEKRGVVAWMDGLVRTARRFGLIGAAWDDWTSSCDTSLNSSDIEYSQLQNRLPFQTLSNSFHPLLDMKPPALNPEVQYVRRLNNKPVWLSYLNRTIEPKID